jgi:hypothetical protein
MKVRFVVADADLPGPRHEIEATLRELVNTIAEAFSPKAFAAAPVAEKGADPLCDLTAAVSDLQLRLDRLQAGHEQLTSQVEREAQYGSRLIAVVERLAVAIGKAELLEAESA